jgi:hypothetical protein
LWLLVKETAVCLLLYDHAPRRGIDYSCIARAAGRTTRNLKISVSEIFRNTLLEVHVESRSRRDLDKLVSTPTQPHRDCEGSVVRASPVYHDSEPHTVTARGPAARKSASITSLVVVPDDIIDIILKTRSSCELSLHSPMDSPTPMRGHAPLNASMIEAYTAYSTFLVAFPLSP